MGFSWARATSFAEPMITVGASTNYYAVDHSPSLLWNSTTWEISEALMPFLRTVMEGPESWVSSDTITRAIEIEDGRVRNAAILTFQERSAEYPYLPAAP
jgi:alanine dehydrogenase